MRGELKRKGSFSRTSRIYTIAVKWRKRNVLFMERGGDGWWWLGDSTDPV